MCWLSWSSCPGCCSCPGLHLRLGASDCAPGLVFFSWALGHLLGFAARSSPTTRTRMGRTAQVFAPILQREAPLEETECLPKKKRERERERGTTSKQHLFDSLDPLRAEHVLALEQHSQSNPMVVVKEIADPMHLSHSARIAVQTEISTDCNLLSLLWLNGMSFAYASTLCQARSVTHLWKSLPYSTVNDLLT